MSESDPKTVPTDSILNVGDGLLVGEDGRVRFWRALVFAYHNPVVIPFYILFCIHYPPVLLVQSASEIRKHLFGWVDRL